MRRIGITLVIFGMGFVLHPAALGQKKGKEIKRPEISDKDFRQIAALVINDPLNRAAADRSRLLILYALQTQSAQFTLGAQELSWMAIDKDPDRALLLLAGYLAGNIQSQLNSGVKRNDPYSGALTLFQIYRSLQQHDKKFAITAVDDLLALHQEDKLVDYLRKLIDKRATKITPETETLLRKLMDRR